MIPVNGTEEKTVGDSIESVAPNGNMGISANAQLLERRDMESLHLVGNPIASENITTDHTKKITTDANDGIATVVHNFKGLGRGDAPMFDGSEIVVGLKGQISHTLRILFSGRSKHYKPILNILQATRSQGYWIPCNTSYRYANEHKCPDKCSACFKTPKCTESDMIKCNKCQRNFYGGECYEIHLKSGSYISINEKN
ncbi:hypothetical protein QAD02_007400 [Eretmocerus hayati]|uniref:Uncharacterized protein n=1 Tax=Eretmocerus hayati TaxID=131215 RepID=A0ACC2N3K1_9HYME|nr:hypothetical protein QAD02_007400 [Eretmocerus hayati]